MSTSALCFPQYVNKITSTVMKVAKKAAPAIHQTYGEMVSAAIGYLKDRKSSSRQAISKYIKGAAIIIISNATPGTNHFFLQSSKILNNLDQHIASVKSRNVFKSKLKAISLDNL